MAAICSRVNGVGVRIRAKEIGGDIESCLKLEDRWSSERFDSSESSDEGVGRLDEFETLAGVEGIGVDKVSRRRV